MQESSFLAVANGGLARTGLPKESLSAIYEWLDAQPPHMLDEHDADLASGDLAQIIKSALIARYPLFVRLHNNVKDWENVRPYFCQQYGPRANEPWIAAAAAALSPAEDWEWKIAEDWSWLYRHAATCLTTEEGFGSWMEGQDPQGSRTYVMERLEKSGRLPSLA